MNDFITYWDTRIDANKRLFDEKPGLANFAYDEAEAAWDKGQRTLRAENERLKGEVERLREALEWLREVDDVREWLAEFPWLRKWSGLDQCMNESRAAVDKLLTIHPPHG